jgi:hypothetical protein
MTSVVIIIPIRDVVEADTLAEALDPDTGGEFAFQAERGLSATAEDPATHTFMHLNYVGPETKGQLDSLAPTTPTWILVYDTDWKQVLSDCGLQRIYRGGAP